MNDKEILQKIIDEAQSLGFDVDITYKVTHLINPYFKEPQIHVNVVLDDGLEYVTSPERIIFSHSFAKALWGEKTLKGYWYKPMLYSNNYPYPDYDGDVEWRSGGGDMVNEDKMKELVKKAKLLKKGQDGFDPIFEPHYDNRSGWKYHLQQMVLEENPIRYLEQFL